MIKATLFSPCRNYRYTLWRQWNSGEGIAMFIGLNPSTADEVKNDPTVTRCINYAKSWGYKAMYMTNIFAYRATDPSVMKASQEPIGCENDHYLKRLANDASIVIAAWGVHGQHNGRADQVKMLIPGLHCLRLTKDGHPAHPLYLPKTLIPLKF